MRPLAVCGALTRDQLPCLAAIARGAQLDAGEALFYEDDPATEVFTVTSGMLKLSKLLPDGRRQITGFLTPGDYLGLAFAEKYVYSAEAVTPVRICRFPRSAFLGLLEQFPALEKALFGRAATELGRGAAADAAAGPQDGPRACRELSLAACGAAGCGGRRCC